MRLGGNVPNALTLVRIGAIPPILAALALEWRLLAFGLFLLAMATDFLDGYLARRWAQTSSLGRMLDPIADKVLAATVLLMLTADSTIAGWHVVPALAILAREVLVSGMREYLAGLAVAMPVTVLAKAKTALQFAAIGLLIAGPAWGAWSGAGLAAGLGLLWIAAAMTAYTGFAYVRAALVHVADGRNGGRP
jgi:cardiolipin synthase